MSTRARLNKKGRETYFNFACMEVPPCLIVLQRMSDESLSVIMRSCFIFCLLYGFASHKHTYLTGSPIQKLTGLVIASEKAGLRENPFGLDIKINLTLIRFGPYGVAVDMEGNGEFDSWEICVDFWRIS